MNISARNDILYVYMNRSTFGKVKAKRILVPTYVFTKAQPFFKRCSLIEFLVITLCLNTKHNT